MKNKNLFIAGIMSISALVLLPGCDWIKNMRNKPHSCASHDGSCHSASEQEAPMAQEQAVEVVNEAEYPEDIMNEEVIVEEIEEK